MGFARRSRSPPGGRGSGSSRGSPTCSSGTPRTSPGRCLCCRTRWRDLVAPGGDARSRWRAIATLVASAAPSPPRPTGSSRAWRPTNAWCSVRCSCAWVASRHRRADPDPLPATPRRTLSAVALVDLLVRAGWSPRRTAVELAHEALVRAWPRLRAWLEEDRPATIRRHLTVAEEWHALGRPASELYQGVRLEAAEEWAARAVSQPTRLEQEFLDASRALVHARTQALADQARHERSQNRRLRGLLAGVGVLLGVLARRSPARRRPGSPPPPSATAPRSRRSRPCTSPWSLGRCRCGAASVTWRRCSP